MTDGEVGVKSNSRAGRRFYLQSRSYLTISHVGAPQLCMSRTRTLKPQMRSKCRAITENVRMEGWPHRTLSALGEVGNLVLIISATQLQGASTLLYLVSLLIGG